MTELHKGKPADFTSTIDLTSCSLEELWTEAYAYAKRYHLETMETFRKAANTNLTPALFWREYIWCVYTSGFNAKIVSQKIDAILAAYGDWKQAKDPTFIWEELQHLIANKQKYFAIRKTRILMQEMGWPAFRQRYLNHVDSMSGLPFIGEVTKYHLARNLGFNTVKPDVHLNRLARRFGCADAYALCSRICNQTERAEPLGVVDFVLWAWSAAFGTQAVA